mgnify:FL=1
MIHYTAKEGTIFKDGEVWGLSSYIYADPHQDLAALVEPKIIEVAPHSRTDYLFVTSEGKVVGVEEKRTGDLVKSWTSHRLQRQLRHLREAVDIPVLALRAPLFGLLERELLSRGHDPYDFFLDLVKWQCLGGLIGFLPNDANEAVTALKSWRAGLVGKQSLLSVLAGDDRTKVRVAGLSPVEAALVRLRIGVGPITAKKLTGALGQHLTGVLSASDEKLKKAGCNAGTLRKLEALK